MYIFGNMYNDFRKVMGVVTRSCTLSGKDMSIEQEDRGGYGPDAACRTNVWGDREQKES